MLVKFHNDYLEKLFTGKPVKGKPKYSEGVVSKFKKCVLILKNVENSMELSKFRGLNFEALKGDKKGLFSRVEIVTGLNFRLRMTWFF